MKNSARIIGIVLFLFGVSLSSAFADEGTRQMDKSGLEQKFYKKAYMAISYADELKIADTQLIKIKALKSKLKKSTIMKEAEINVLALEISDELGEEKIDLDSVNKLLDRKYELKKQLAKELVEAYVELREILTEEQMAKMKDLKMQYSKKEKSSSSCPMMKKMGKK